MHNPIDLLAPSVPAVAGPAATGAALGAAAGSTSPRVDPYQYDNSGYGQNYGEGNYAAEQQQNYTSPTSEYGSNASTYDPYAHAQPMQMPDPHNYMGSGPAGNYGYGAEGGYAVAAAAGAGAGAAGYGAYNRVSGQHQRTPSGNYQHTAGPNATPAGIAKAQEAQAERERGANRVSGGWGAGPSGAVTEEAHGRPMSDNGTVYQHTDMGSAGDEREEQSEIPPK